MADKVLENNQVSIVGEIVSDFSYSHEVYGEGFFVVEVAVNRLSNYADYIPLMVSERLIDTTQSYIGEKIHVTGQFRSYNRHEETKNRLILSVFVRELEFVDEYMETRMRKERAITSHWMAMCAKPRFIVKRRWDGRSQIFWWQLTALMENQITFHASVGAEMPVMPRHLRSAVMSA